MFLKLLLTMNLCMAAVPSYAGCHHYLIALMNHSDKSWVVSKFQTPHGELVDADRFIKPHDMGVIELQESKPSRTGHEVGSIEVNVTFSNVNNMQESFTIGARQSHCLSGLGGGQEGEISTSLSSSSHNIQHLKDKPSKRNKQGMSLFEIS